MLLLLFIFELIYVVVNVRVNFGVYAAAVQFNLYLVLSGEVLVSLVCECVFGFDISFGVVGDAGWEWEVGVARGCL